MAWLLSMSRSGSGGLYGPAQPPSTSRCTGTSSSWPSPLSLLACPCSQEAPEPFLKTGTAFQESGTLPPEPGCHPWWGRWLTHDQCRTWRRLSPAFSAWHTDCSRSSPDTQAGDGVSVELVTFPALHKVQQVHEGHQRHWGMIRACMHESRVDLIA